MLFEGNQGQIAEVYILSSKDFDLKGSYEKTPAGSGIFVIELREDTINPKVAYLVPYMVVRSNG